MAKRPAEAPDLWFPPHVLREYALLADGERGIMVGPRGDFSWMCAPRWDSDAVFSSLIGGQGMYSVTPTVPFVWGGYYEKGSLIWRSRWTTQSGVIESREALLFPGDPDRVVVLRRILAQRGEAVVRVALDVAGKFGRVAARSLKCNDGHWTGRVGNLRMRWSGGEKARFVEGARRRRQLLMELRIAEGDHHDLVLEITAGKLADAPINADVAWTDTEYAWRMAVPRFENTIAPDDARHSYAILRGLTSSSGAMVAAATSSLPERAERDRNYDYRYAWIRDQCYAGQAIAADAPHPLLDDALRFITGRLHEDGPGLKPAYTVTGGPIPGPQSLDLPGYPGARDMIGNQVNSQFQLDIFGESLLLLAAAARHDHIDATGWRAAEIASDAIARRWQEADAGIWEIDNRDWTHSRLMCVAGLRAMAREAAAASPGLAASWNELADRITAHTASTSLHVSGRWQRSPDDPGVDAALLLPPIRGALPATDSRTVATLRAFQQDLTDDFYAYRFRQAPGPLSEAEGAFLLCGFIMALATYQQGDDGTAMRWFERNRAACGPPGLYSEEFDIGQRQLRGNIPQAFVHALMLESAARLARPWGQTVPG